MTSFAPHDRVVQWLERDARAPESDVRETALDRLGSLPDTVDIISASLADPDPEVRGAAAANLGRVRLAKAWPPLLHAAHDETDDDVLFHIVRSFDGYLDSTILELLLGLLDGRDRDYRIRFAVVAQVWKYDPAVVRPRLIEVVLGDDNDIVRAGAADSLELLDAILPSDPQRHALWLRLVGDGAPGVAKSADKVLRRELVTPVAEVLSEISRRLHHPIGEERDAALYRLSMFAEPAAAMAIPLLDDEQPAVRGQCCICLGVIRDCAAINPLLATLRSDPESRVKTNALLGLENYYTPEIGEHLLDTLETKSLTGDALSILCRQLWKYPSSRTIALVQDVLGSSAKLTQRHVVESALAFLTRF